VGITRAKNRLELSWYTNPGEPGIAGEESRYLKMIPQELLEGMPDEKERWANLQQLKKEVQEKAQKEVQEKEQKELRQEVKPEDQQEQADMRAGIQAVVQVRHPKYGVGVLRSEDDLMVEAEFDGYGVKQFLKAFGEVEIIG
jgi:DNA helicase-2/ATP-dependent DNA helicase PcrA